MMQSEEIRLRGERDKMAKLREARLAQQPVAPVRPHAVETESTGVQVERVLTIIRDHGPCTDMDIERLFKEKFGEEITSNSVHARRNDLMDEDLVGDTGRRAINDKSGQKVTLWGLTQDIPAAQRRINIYKRTSYRQAFDFADRQPDDYKSMCFLRAWMAESWDELSANWPDFIQFHAAFARAKVSACEH